MRRRLSVAVMVGLMVASAGLAAPLTLVSSGQSQAQVIVGAAASAQVQEAANALVRYVREASGATLPLVKDDAVPAGFAGVSIRVGQTAGTDTRGLLPEGLDGDGFVLRAGGTEIVILGPTDDGTEFGVYEFLERYVGVRWLLPGEHGTDVPAQATLTVPEETQVVSPVFMSRLLSGLRGPVQMQWARCNRMHGRIEFHHNLVHVVPPTKYGASHPEFFPVHGEQRFVPSIDTDSGWQPCFSAPGLAEKAQNLPSPSTRLMPPAGRWTLLVTGGVVPAEVKGTKVGYLRPLPILDGFQDGGKVYIDDIALYKLE